MRCARAEGSSGAFRSKPLILGGLPHTWKGETAAPFREGAGKKANSYPPAAAQKEIEPAMRDGLVEAPKSCKVVAAENGTPSE